MNWLFWDVVNGLVWKWNGGQKEELLLLLLLLLWFTDFIKKEASGSSAAPYQERTDECRPALINLEVAAVAEHERVIISPLVEATLAAPGLHRHRGCRGYYFTVTDGWNVLQQLVTCSWHWPLVIIQKFKKEKKPVKMSFLPLMLLSWCSTCSFSLFSVLLVLSKSNQSGWDLIPTPFFSFLKIRLCWFTLVKILGSRIWTHGLVPQERLSEQPSHSLVLHQVERSEISVDATSSSAQLRARLCFQKKLKVISEIICRSNHGNQQGETVVPLMFWKVFNLPRQTFVFF